MNIISVVVSNSKIKIKDKICFSMGLSQASLCFNWISVSVFASPVSFSVIVSNANETWYAKVSRSFLTDELKIALTVTENSFSMGLFTKDGESDYTPGIWYPTALRRSSGAKIFSGTISRMRGGWTQRI